MLFHRNILICTFNRYYIVDRCDARAVKHNSIERSTSFDHDLVSRPENSDVSSRLLTQCASPFQPENGDYNARPSCITLRRLHDGYASLNLKPMRASVWELQAAPVLAVDVKGRLCRSSRSSFRQYAVEHGWIFASVNHHDYPILEKINCLCVWIPNCM